MALHTWWLFVGAVFLLSGTPGPNMLHIMTRSVDLGLKRSVAAMAGCLSAVVLVLAASAAGLTTLLWHSGSVRGDPLCGCRLSVVLGVKAWRADSAPIDVSEGVIMPSMSRTAVFRGGFLIGISNPKLILFAVAFLPQFINPARAQVLQFAILVGTFAVIEAFWYAIYALGGRSLSRYLNRPAVKRAFNRVTGAIFMGFGLALLRVKPA